MKTINKQIILSLPLLLVTQISFAETDVLASIGVNKKDMEFGRSFDTNSTDTSFIMASVSVTALFDGFYLTLSGESPISKEDVGEGINTVKSDRSEGSLTAGCNCLPFAEEVSVYIGYTSAKTRIEGNKPLQAFTEDHTDTGFYVGGSMPVYEGENKTLSISAAYAVLDGEVDSFDEFVGVTGTFSGDTTGLSYSASLVGFLTETMNYSIVYKVQDYFFETDAFGVDKKFTNLSLNMSYFF